MSENTTANDINIELIMKQIREGIKERGADKIPLSFREETHSCGATHANGASRDFSSRDDDISKSVTYLGTNYEVSAYEMLLWNKIKVFIKKVIRKLAAFFVLPIVRQQNILNYHYYRVAEAVAIQRDEVEELKKIENELEKRVEALEKTMSANCDKEN